MKQGSDNAQQRARKWDSHNATFVQSGSRTGRLWLGPKKIKIIKKKNHSLAYACGDYAVSQYILTHYFFFIFVRSHRFICTHITQRAQYTRSDTAYRPAVRVDILHRHLYIQTGSVSSIVCVCVWMSECEATGCREQRHSSYKQQQQQQRKSTQSEQI